ncbi:mannose-1-phosphate guanylyltransferase/mannose-6-phosphate isomerase, partial [bacterium]|nr:mannose-1-phosphate guanylyltransferase/mannose-6-phosphate isomerase [bacterium]
MLVPVILCGGVGSRLWPLSREQHPKQFHHLGLGEQSLLQQTVLRVAAVADVSQAIVVCNEEHRFLVAEQLRELELGQLRIVLEPAPRNTAPAVAAAAIDVASRFPEQDPMLWVLPADHAIANIAELEVALERSVQLAAQSRLVTFGVPATAPETGYGYIQRGAAVGEAGFDIVAFVEKPDRQHAERYVEDEHYFWNSGMFVFKAQVYLDELKCFVPAMLDAVSEAVAGATMDLDFLRLAADAFARSPSDSIDYAVMESTQQGAVVTLDADWSDVGSWSGLWSLSEKDADGNVSVGDVVASASQNNLFYSDSRLVAALGVSDLMVVETADAVLVAHRSQSQALKAMVDALRAEGRAELSAHQRVYRPWGWYETVCSGERFQVKRIEVSPGQKLSLQMHQYLAVNLLVVLCLCRVTCNDTVMM